ncbi:prephenate dehydratase [bacterium 1XD42-8]|jgi:chorismate mutase/prephenate dehydratase|nr:prephenate dehydratase [Lachnospiraceae bacterium]RKJ50903.1 prephenate dehydratase [bacterium 1XD42-8]
MDLLELRDEIDKIDREIVRLYEERMKISQQVAEYKITTGKKVLDKEREIKKLNAVKDMAHNDFNRYGIEELFEQIMSMSRKLQYQMLTEKGIFQKLPFMEVDRLEVKEARIVFPGTNGAYSQEAMDKYFGEGIHSFHVDNFREAMEAIEEGRADFAILPIENSQAGSVHEIYDMLVEFENYIVGEQIIPIEHCLLVLPGTKIEDIQTIYSHPQSLMQSSKFLHAHSSIRQVGMQNNAFAAKKVMEDRDRSQAAIASAKAGEVYELEVLERGVNNSTNNSTRFIIVTNQKIFCKDAKKMSICFEVPHKSGSLYHMLSHFIYNHLNMNRIESRPLLDRTWEYRFFIDFEGNLGDGAVKNALRGLREEAANMRILGNY